MTALALHSHRARVLACQMADRLLVEHCITRLEPEAAMASGAELDRLVMAALGWEVQESRTRGHAWRCRSPWQATWSPVPRVSESVTEVEQYVVPWRWDHGAGRRGGKPFGWVRLSDAVFFEATGVTSARCLLKAALFGQRWIAMQREAA